jgi:hypothetical protein
MDKRQRIAMQRAMMREAFGKIQAATELFGVEDGAVSGSAEMEELHEFERRAQEFEEWVFSESGIA